MDAYRRKHDGVAAATLLSNQHVFMRNNNTNRSGWRHLPLKWLPREAAPGSHRGRTSRGCRLGTLNKPIIQKRRSPPTCIQQASRSRRPPRPPPNDVFDQGREQLQPTSQTTGCTPCTNIPAQPKPQCPTPRNLYATRSLEARAGRPRPAGWTGAREKKLPRRRSSHSGC